MNKKMDIYAELDDFVEENEGQVTLTDVAKHFAEYGYQYAQTHPNWISVEDELPKCNIVDCGLATYPVLVYREDGFIDISCYDSEVGEWDCVGVVTHWMPIVPPRKEE